MTESLSIEKFEYVPGRIEAAMRYVEFCRSLTEAVNCCGGSTHGRALSASERAAYETALDALRLYFAGEQDFGGTPMRAPDSAPMMPEREAQTPQSRWRRRKKENDPE